MLKFNVSVCDVVINVILNCEVYKGKMKILLKGLIFDKVLFELWV